MKAKYLSTKLIPCNSYGLNEKAGYPHINKLYYNYDLLYIQNITMNSVEKVTHKVQKPLK